MNFISVIVKQMLAPSTVGFVMKVILRLHIVSEFYFD